MSLEDGRKRIGVVLGLERSIALMVIVISATQTGCEVDLLEGRRFVSDNPGGSCGEGGTCIASPAGSSYVGWCEMAGVEGPVYHDTYEEPVGGTWYDSTSGLEWQVTPTGGEMKWENAKSHCAGLTLAGGGWHLPTISELRSLIRGCTATKTGGSCGVTDSCLDYSDCRDSTCSGCSDLGGPAEGGAYWPDELKGEIDWYWSSSPVADDGYAFNVYFDGGYVNYSTASGNRIHVRCVR